MCIRDSIKAVVGIGTPISNVKDLATSFKEAQIAMEVSLSLIHILKGPLPEGAVAGRRLGESLSR